MSSTQGDGMTIDIVDGKIVIKHNDRVFTAEEVEQALDLLPIIDEEEEENISS